MAALELVQTSGSTEGAGKLVRVRELANHVGLVIAGQYLLREARDVADGTPHLQLSLADATGKVSAFVWPEWRDKTEMPPVGRPVSVTAEVRAYEDSQQLKVHRLTPLAAEDVRDVADLLPGVPEQVRDALRAIESSLPPKLRQFLVRVLLDTEIGPAFLTCRASAQHHHAAAHGLITHSVENVDLMRALVGRLMPKDPVAPGIAQVGYLFHDIGKIRTVGTTERPPLAFAVRHEFRNVTVLAEHLKWLERVDPVLHAGLLATFEYLATPAHDRTWGAYLPARVVAAFDQWSAATFDSVNLDDYVRQGPRSQPHRRFAGRWQDAKSHRGVAA